MYVHHVMEVCCIVFDIDGMLSILEKKKSFWTVTWKRIAPCHGVCCIVFDIDGIFLEYFFSHFMFSLRFMLFPI